MSNKIPTKVKTSDRRCNGKIYEFKPACRVSYNFQIRY